MEGLPESRVAGWGVEADDPKLLRFGRLQGVLANLLLQDSVPG